MNNNQKTNRIDNEVEDEKIFRYENAENLGGEEIELDEEDEASLDKAWEQLRREIEKEKK